MQYLFQLKKLFVTLTAILCTQIIYTQNCKTTAGLDAVPGQYLTAAQHPWPAARAGYFESLKTVADKAMAKKILEQIEKKEQQSRAGFNLTGGNWENTFSSNGYEYAGSSKLAKYYFQAAHYEFFCASGKQKRNSEYGTVLRVYVNSIPVNTLDRFIKHPFGRSFGNYDLGFEYADWKNHKLTDPGDKLINLFTYLSCNNSSLLEAINMGQNYFQDVAEKDVKPNSRVPLIHRYWFVKNSKVPVLVPVSRKEYLLGLLEYYDREKLYFAKLVLKLKADRDNSVKQYEGWEVMVNEKIDIVNKTLTTQNEDWLGKQAVINRLEDASQNYKRKLAERVSYNRFWRFYDNEKKSEPLYQYNPEYFKTLATGAATPQLITVAFRYVTMPSSLRLLENFTSKFDYNSYLKLL
ncbi:MAG TPA: hypothetical protein PKA77_00380 [Chitinophagaceae bacterium]|jgi:hypothetical protein|nr:hypothetical protein [Chitinophagaceae bacterium]HMU59115.1 hypothetical protein [Chitinophagaceae bacterium]